MDFYDIVKHAADDAGISISAVGRAMGKPSNYVSNGVGKGASPRLDTAAAMLRACGYTLCALPDGNVPAGALVIDPPR